MNVRKKVLAALLAGVFMLALLPPMGAVAEDGVGGEGGTASPTDYYTVTFDANGGRIYQGEEDLEGVETLQVDVKKGDKVAPPSDIWLAIGYTLEGWYTGKDLKTKWNFDIPVDTDITLYANWSEGELKTFSVDVPPTKTVYKVGDALDLSGIFVKFDFAEAGSWRIRFASFGSVGIVTDPVDGTILSKTDKKVTITYVGGGTHNIIPPIALGASVDLTIHVQEESDLHAVTFDANDGWFYDGWLHEDDTQTITTYVMKDQTVEAPARVIYRYGHVFDGWYKDQKATQPWDVKTDKVTEDITLYAKWVKAKLETLEVYKEPVKVVYAEGEELDLRGLAFRIKFNDGTVMEWDQRYETLVEDGLIASPAQGDTLTKGVTKVVFTFMGLTAELPISVYDESKLRTVTFDANEGLFSGTDKPTETVKALVGGTVKAPSNAPYRFGYKLAGWYKDRAGTQPWNFETDKVNDNLTLYTGWEKANIISFKINSDTIPSVTVNYMEGQTLDLEELEFDIVFDDGEEWLWSSPVSYLKDNGLTVNPALGTPLSKSDTKVAFTFMGLTAELPITVKAKQAGGYSDSYDPPATPVPSAPPVTTVANAPTGAAVTGAIPAGAVLTITELSLPAPGTNAAADAIRKEMSNKDAIVLLAKDIKLSKSFSGKLTVTLPVDAMYNGQTVVILHDNNGTLERYTAVVKDGKVVFEVTSLSPFVVLVYKSTLTSLNVPNTGDAPSAGIALLLCLIAASGVFAARSMRGKKAGRKA